MLTDPADILVADIEKNRSNTFWQPRIGERGIRVHVESDGRWFVIMERDGAPCPGVDADRFTVLETLRKPVATWSEYPRRRRLSLLALAVGGIVAVLYVVVRVLSR